MLLQRQIEWKLMCKAKVRIAVLVAVLLYFKYCYTNTYTNYARRQMFEVKKLSMPGGKCQGWDCLLSLCPAGCACNIIPGPTRRDNNPFMQLFILNFLSVVSMWPQAYRRHCPDPCLHEKLLISWWFFPEALILPQFECFRQYACLKEKTPVFQGHSKCIGSFLRQKMT